MSISLDQIKILRDKTGVSITACKKALEEAGGDQDKALELLRKKGEAKAASRQDRSTSEGVVAFSQSGDKTVLVKVLCETDFVAKNQDFIDAANGLAALLLERGIDADLSAEVADLSLKMGEKLVLANPTLVQGNVIGVYVHSNHKLGAAVELEGATADLAKQVAMHVTASNPSTLNPQDVPQELIDKEYVIWNDEMQKSGKPKEIWDKILTGKETKFRKGLALSTQDFVIDPSVDVATFLKNNSAELKNFVNLRV